ncbi:DUF937 domain-containing protein [Alkalinema sp. FACHB-956]|uniref:DUF937 domain-containing protein n=1 Tax=Alkalinema sp. FACHB-956 TaxID=2692768 RepID=UPI00168781F6|nr:DUF937 domain-containing protein [Alkalinema sp. FACHB-956]MBD2329586.1 DUF937 domain-containing protein [Alkalinema sp. FACHB-956]
MSLFDQILGAIENPNQQGSPDQLGSILGTVQQLAGQTGMDQQTSQMVMSMVGGYVRSALQDQQATQGSDAVQATVNQLSGTSADPQALSTLFSPAMQQQIATAIGDRTGLDPNLIQGILPTLVPVVLNVLQTGASTQGMATGNNPLLSLFLDSNQDGDVDIGDAMNLAAKFLN